MAEDISDNRWYWASLLIELDQTLDRLADEYRNELGARDPIVTSIDQRVQTFKRQLHALVDLDDNKQRTATATAIVSALWIGAAMASCPNILNGVTKLVRAAGTKPARAARQRSDIQEIIDNHANALWKRKPSLKTNQRQTAIQIYDGVAANIDSVRCIPKWWASQPSEVPQQTKSRRIEAIRKRIKIIRGLED